MKIKITKNCTWNRLFKDGARSFNAEEVVELDDDIADIFIKNGYAEIKRRKNFKGVEKNKAITGTDENKSMEEENANE